MTPASLAEHKYEKGVYKTPMNSIPFMTPMEKNETWIYGRMPEYIWISLILDIIYPSMAKEQDNPERLKQMTRRAVKTTSYFQIFLLQY